MGAVAEGKLRLLWHYRFPTESSRGAAWAVGEDGTPPPKPMMLLIESWEGELQRPGKCVRLPFKGPPPTPASSHCPLCWFPSSFPFWAVSSAGAFPTLGTVLAQWREEVGPTAPLPTSPEVKCRREGTSNALGSWP